MARSRLAVLDVNWEGADRDSAPLSQQRRRSAAGCERDDTKRLRVCRVVTLASATGQYGGPYDTARRQARLAAMMGADVALVAAHLPGDRSCPPSFPARWPPSAQGSFARPGSYPRSGRPRGHRASPDPTNLRWRRDRVTVGAATDRRSQSCRRETWVQCSTAVGRDPRDPLGEASQRERYAE